jgi:hypothetical protein
LLALAFPMFLLLLIRNKQSSEVSDILALVGKGESRDIEKLHACT